MIGALVDLATAILDPSGRTVARRARRQAAAIQRQADQLAQLRGDVGPTARCGRGRRSA